MLLKNKHKTSGEGRVKAAPFLLFFTFLLLNTNVFSAALLPKDSAKSKYELNDPRNPNCPCHKYQRQAENEYKQLQAQANFTNINYSNKGNSEVNKFDGNDA